MSLKDKTTPSRIFALDALRVFAIVMMIAYHFIYDLKYFGYVDWNTPLGNGFWQWRSSILFGFIFAMGLSMGIAHGRGRRPRSFVKRLAQIFGCAVLITSVTLFMFPETFIYFGILHFMTLASLLTYSFIGRPKLALVIGIAIAGSFWVGFVPYGWPIKLIPNLPVYTEDFVSPFPWFGIALIGSALGEKFIKNPDAVSRVSNRRIEGASGKFVSFAGKRSLSIYMLHQPILFALIIGAGFLMKTIAS